MSKAIQAGEAYVRLSVRGAKDMERRLDRAQRMLRNFSREAMKIGTAAGAIGVGLGAALKPAIDAASKWENAMFRANAVFKDSSDQIIGWADKTASAYGRSRRGVLDFTTTAALMFKNLGVEQGKAISMAQELAKRSILFANLSGISAEDMQTRFVRALSGSAEVLDQFGVNLKENALKLEQLRMGIPVSEFNEYTKILARFNLLIKDTNVAMDAGAPGTYIDFMQQLKAAFERISEVLGTELKDKLKFVFAGIASGLKELSKRPKLLAQIAYGAVGVIAALGVVAVSFIAVGMATAVLAKMFAVLLVTFKGFVAVSAAAGKIGWQVGKGFLWGLYQLPKILPAVNKGMKALARDIALIQKLGTKKIPILTQAFKPGAATKFSRSLAVYTGRAGMGTGGPTAAWQRTGFATMSRGLNKTSRVVDVLTHRLKAAGTATRAGLVNGVKSARKGFSSLFKVAGKLAARVQPAATAVWLMSEGFTIAKQTAAGSFKAIVQGVSDISGVLITIPSIFEIMAKDPSEGAAMMQKVGEIIVSEMTYVGEQISDILYRAFTDAFERALDYSLFIIPTISKDVKGALGDSPFVNWLFDVAQPWRRFMANEGDDLGAQLTDLLGMGKPTADMARAARERNRLTKELFDMGMAYNEREHEQFKRETRFGQQFLKGEVAGPVTARGVGAMTPEERRRLYPPGVFGPGFNRLSAEDYRERRLKRREQLRMAQERYRLPDLPKGGSRAFGGLSTQDVVNQMKADANYSKEIAEHTKKANELAEERNNYLERMRMGSFWAR